MIRIISGTYGCRENGRVVPKTSKSEPFALDEKEEKRLVDAGVAVYVEGVEAPKKTEDSKGKEKPKVDKKADKKAVEGVETETPPSFSAEGTVV